VLNPQAHTKTSSLLHILRDRAKEQPDRVAYIFLLNGETESESITYGELYVQARAIAAKLQSWQGERALLLYPSGLDFIKAFFGCLYAGVVAVPVYPPRRKQKMSRLLSIFSDAEAKIALTTNSLMTNVNGQLAQSMTLTSIKWLATDYILTNQLLDWKETEINQDTLALLQYTSGSTGTPKGVMVTHGNLLHNSALIHKSFEHTPNSKGVVWLPPYHDMGLIGGVLQPLYGGFPVVLMSPLAFLKKPLRWLQAISRYKATTSGGPNFAYELLCKRITSEQLSSLDLSSWEVAFTGAEPIRVQTLERFTSYFADCGFRKEAFYPCFGLAETTLITSGVLKTESPNVRLLNATELEKNRVVFVNKKEETNLAIIGCGKSCLNQKIVIVDPESFNRCKTEQVGEIWVSGPSVAKGYWNKPLQTDETFQVSLKDSGEGPFLRTGDLGFLDDGELFVTGRLKDLIIIQGRNHYPQDIELTVEQSNSALRSGCGAAFSIEFANQEKLVIAQEVERSHLRKLNANKVIETIHRAIAQQHDLQVYAVLLLKHGSLPKTSSGKIQRRACRDNFLAGSLDLVADWSVNPRGKAKFLNLEADVKSLYQNLQTDKKQEALSEVNNNIAVTRKKESFTL